jgi:hypothetical protein
MGILMAGYDLEWGDLDEIVAEFIMWMWMLLVDVSSTEPSWINLKLLPFYYSQH